jgi:serine/threonine protein kinase
VYKGPDWWVKIADFGISKRATEGLTALRTQIGSPAFAAPEVLGFVQSGNELEDSYTNTVDIWSLGVITFLILTGETLFSNPRRLGRYVSGSFQFPSDVLITNKVSEDGCEFVKRLMAAKSEDRPKAKECLEHPWLDCLTEEVAHETQRYYTSSAPLESFSHTDNYSDCDYVANLIAEPSIFQTHCRYR